MCQYQKMKRLQITYNLFTTTIKKEGIFMKNDTKKKVMEILNCSNVQNSNANVDEYSFGGRKFEAAGILLKEVARDEFIEPDVWEAFQDNRIYIHDMDNYATGMHNCLFIDFAKLFKDGFTTRNGDVRPPRSISTAMQQVAVIFQCQSQVQFGK